MQSLSLKQSLPAHLSLTLRDPSHWLPSSLDSSLVHVLPDDVARLTRQELDFIFSNGPGTPPAHYSCHSTAHACNYILTPPLN